MANGEFNHRLSEFIVVIRKLVPEKECAKMIEACKESPFWKMSNVGHEVQQIYVTDSQVKSSDPKFDKLDIDVFQYASRAYRIYIETLSNRRSIKYVPEITEDEGYNFLHYRKGSYFAEHCDDIPGLNRVLALTINLNEDYDGGLFKFFSGEFDIKLGTGDAVMFPSNFMFPHEVTEITRGERHSMVTWFR